MNEFCDFDTFVLVAYGAIAHIKKIGLMGLEFPELFDRTYLLSIYLKSKSSEYIATTIKESYKGYISKFEEKNAKFSLIDALEQSSLNDWTHLLIPELKSMLQADAEYEMRQSVINNPYLRKKLPHIDQRGEDLNLTRMSPFMPINPLKAHKANPVYNIARQIKTPKHQISMAKARVYKGFSTVNQIKSYH